MKERGGVVKGEGRGLENENSNRRGNALL